MQPEGVIEILELLALVAMVKQRQSSDDRRHRRSRVLEAPRHIDHKREQRSWLQPCLSWTLRLDVSTLLTTTGVLCTIANCYKAYSILLFDCQVTFSDFHSKYI